jgi:hypothetical protein
MRRVPVRIALPAGAVAAAAVVAAVVVLAGSGGGGGPSPSCVPPVMNPSALLGGSVTVSPTPTSLDASAQAQISFLGLPASRLRHVSVVGSRSGTHAGRMEAYSQGDGASFVPDRELAQGELVRVRAEIERAGRWQPIAWSFHVAERDHASGTVGEAAVSSSSAPEYQRFHSDPALRPPAVTVLRSTPGATPGDIMVAPYAGPGQWGPMILDENGRLLWFKPLPAGWRAGDLRVQRYDGHTVLTWWQDPLPYGGRHDAGVVIDNTAYRTIQVVRAGNGYQPDLHEFVITPQGTALTTVFDAIRCDVRAAGGPRDGAVADTLLQEIDLRTGLVMYEWHSLDHVPLQDSYERATLASHAHPFDYFHINSIDVAPDGDLLVDSRNTWAAYDVDPRTGRVRWTLGGKHSTFKLAAGAATAYQHDGRYQAGADVTFFDNGGTPVIHATRALELHLDIARKVATVVHSYEHKPGVVSPSQGNVQVLGNGDWMIGWGQASYFTQLGPAGEVLFDAHLPLASESYRAYRQAWSAQPETEPAISYEAASSASATGRVYVSWNGATDVASWRLRSGPSAAQLHPVATVPRTGFETAIDVPAGEADPYVQVQALSSTGAVRGTSASER